MSLLQDMTANSVLMGLETIWWNLGLSQSFIVESDAGSNLIPLSTTVLEQEEQIGNAEKQQKLISDLKLLLQKKKIIFKPNISSSQNRNSLAESLIKIVKSCLKRSQLKDKTMTIHQWGYVISRICYNLNSRCLNIRFIEDTFKILSPVNLIFGSRNWTFPRHSGLQLENLKLYQGMHKLDEQIKSFERLWMHSYLHQIRIMTNKKFKYNKQELSVNSVVLILDKINHSTKQPVIGVITECLSDRSFKIQYVSREAKINPETYKIEKVAKKKELYRPAQKLSFICMQDCREEISIDPFLMGDMRGGVDNDNQDADVGVEEDVLVSDGESVEEDIGRQNRIKVQVPDQDNISTIENI